MKLKITKYLRRAEEIFTCHLQKTLGGGASPGTVRRPAPQRPGGSVGRELSSASPQARRLSPPVLGCVQGQGCPPAIPLAPPISHTQLVPSFSDT